MTRDLAGRFDAFVAKARRIQGRQSPQGTAAFEAFIQSARPRIQRLSIAIYQKIRSFQRDLAGDVPTFDLFDVLGISGKENRYSDALSWLVKPGESGERLARNVLAAVTPLGNYSAPAGKLMGVGREVSTRDGRVDLVLEFADIAVVIEVKVWSLEHDTPSGRAQTNAYREAIEHRLASRGHGKPAVCVLLSPDGRAPANPTAGRISFVTLGRLILEHVADTPIKADVTVARLVGLHFIDTGARSFGGRLDGLLEAPLPQEPNNDWWQHHMPNLLSLADLLVLPSEVPT